MALTLATIRSDVSFRFRDSTNTFITNTEIDRWANEVQADIAQSTGFLRQERAFALTTGQPFVLLPTDFGKLEQKPVYKNSYPLRILNEAEWYLDPSRVSRIGLTGIPLFGYLDYAWDAGSTRWRMWVSPVPSASSTNSTINQVGGITASSTSVILTDASSFPASGYIIIESEQIFYASKSTNTLNGLIRGMGGTDAATHADAVAVSVGELVLIYSRLPRTITTTQDAEVGAEDQGTLINGVLAIAYLADRNPKQAGYHQALYLKGKREMRRRYLWPDQGQDAYITPSPGHYWTYGGSWEEWL